MKSLFLPLILLLFLNSVNGDDILHDTEYDSRINRELSSSSCGLPNNGTVVRRIVGGRKALPGEFPYQVALQSWSLWSGYQFFCGGSIINEYWVLTAGHCIRGQSIRGLRIIVGTTKQQNHEGNSFSIERAIVHEDYNSWTVENDIALLKTTHSMTETSKDFSNTICLPESKASFDGEVVVTGWGTTSEGGGRASSDLMTTSVNLLPDETCRAHYGDAYRPPGMICAGILEGGKDTCQGDSGGPCAVKTPSGFIQVGITSFGEGCARKNVPGVYTRVSHYIPWIEKVIESHR